MRNMTRSLHKNGSINTVADVNFFFYESSSIQVNTNLMTTGKNPERCHTLPEFANDSHIQSVNIYFCAS